MIRLRTAAGAVGWHDAAEKEAADMVASGLWVRADSLDYSRTKHGEMPDMGVTAERMSAALSAGMPPGIQATVEVKRGPGRPRKVQP